MATYKSVLAFGNPLLDFTMQSKSIDIINKYHLPVDGQLEVSKELMKSIMQDLKEVFVSPGGCSQNSLRVLQWMLKKNNCKASIFGSVGADSDGERLKTALETDGVTARYIIQNGLTTGKTVALVNGPNRCLVCHIGAAEVLPLNSLIHYPDFTKIFDNSDMVYIEAFFLTNRFETAKYITDLSTKCGKLLIFNLCGVYIFETIPNSIEYLVKNAKIIFGNLEEFTELVKLLKYPSIDSMITALIDSDKQLVITNNNKQIQYHSKEETIEIVPPLIETIKDTTAAGDAFVGGFLAGLVTSKSARDCLNSGIYAAAAIIQQQGCSIPLYEARNY